MAVSARCRLCTWPASSLARLLLRGPSLRRGASFVWGGLAGAGGEVLPRLEAGRGRVLGWRGGFASPGGGQGPGARLGARFCLGWRRAGPGCPAGGEVLPRLEAGRGRVPGWSGGFASPGDGQGLGARLEWGFCLGWRRAGLFEKSKTRLPKRYGSGWGSVKEMC